MPAWGTAAVMSDERVPLGHPAGDPEDRAAAHTPDIAGEHEDTAVDKDITGGADSGESESPDGWAGLESSAGPN